MVGEVVSCDLCAVFWIGDSTFIVTMQHGRAYLNVKDGLHELPNTCYCMPSNFLSIVAQVLTQISSINQASLRVCPSLIFRFLDVWIPLNFSDFSSSSQNGILLFKLWGISLASLANFLAIRGASPPEPCDFFALRATSSNFRFGAFVLGDVEF